MPIALRRALVVVVVASAFAALAWVVTRAGLLLSNDGPAPLYAWYALAHIDDPKFAPFVVANPLLTYRGLATIFALADAAFGWRNAFIACNVLVALAYAGGFLAVVIAARERCERVAATIPTARWPMGLLGIAFALQLPFYIGLLQYQLGTALGLFAIASWLRRRVSLVDHAALAALLYAAAAVHTFAAVLAGVVCATITVFEVRSPRRLLGVVAAGTPAAAVFFLSLELAADLSSPSVWPSVFERVRLVGSFLPGAAWRGLLAWPLVVAAGLHVIARWSRTSLVERALAVTGIGLLAAALGPRDWAGWQLFSLRPLPFAAPLLAALVVAHVPVRVGRVLHACALAYVGATLIWAAWFHASLRAADKDLVERIASLTPAPATRGAIVATPASNNGIPLREPYRNLPALASIRLGGIAAYLRGADAVAAKHPATVPPGTMIERLPASGPARRDFLRRLTALNAPIGALVAFGAPEDLDVVEAGGFVREQRIDAEDGLGVLVARFEGCGARLRVVGAHDGARTIDVGWWPMADQLGTVELTGEAHFDGLGCGAMWFRFGGLACREADAGGRVRATLLKDRSVEVRCSLASDAPIAPP